MSYPWNLHSQQIYPPNFTSCVYFAPKFINFGDGIYRSLSKTKRSIVVCLPSSIVNICMNSVIYNTLFVSETCKRWFFAPLTAHAWFNEQCRPLWCLLTHSHTQYLTTLQIHSLTHLISHSHSLTFTDSLSYSLTHLLTHWVVSSPINLLMHSLFQLLTYSISKSLTY